MSTGVLFTKLIQVYSRTVVLIKKERSCNHMIFKNNIITTPEFVKIYNTRIRKDRDQFTTTLAAQQSTGQRQCKE